MYFSTYPSIKNTLYNPSRVYKMNKKFSIVAHLLWGMVTGLSYEIPRWKKLFIQFQEYESLHRNHWVLFNCKNWGKSFEFSKLLC